MGIPLDRNRRFPHHPSDGILEDYTLRRLPEALAGPVEEHLLLCHSCQDAVAEIDEFVAALKGSRSQPPAWQSPLPSLAGRKSLGPMVALVILTLMVFWKNPEEVSRPVAVTLSSMRGSNTLSSAQAEKRLDLNIDAPDLALRKEYSLEVVDAAGRSVWKGAASEASGKLTATISKPLRTGVYWVRLYGANSELLREFGLSAK